MIKSIAILMILLISNNALAFDAIKKWISPKSYWQNKVAEAEKIVKIDKAELYSCRLDLAELQRTRDIIIRRNVLMGMTPREAQEDFTFQYQAALEVYKISQEILQESQKNLEQAKDELKKVQ